MRGGLRRDCGRLAAGHHNHLHDWPVHLDIGRVDLDIRGWPTGEFTKQGTELKFGEKALVPVKTGGTLGVTATSIMKGDPADLAPLQLGDKAAGQTPWYINFTITNESGDDLSAVSVGLTGGLLGDGSRAASVSIIGRFRPCENATSPRTFTTKGASFTTCRLALAGGTAMVTAATYTGSSNDIPDADYIRDPIVWK